MPSLVNKINIIKSLLKWLIYKCILGHVKTVPLGVLSQALGYKAPPSQGGCNTISLISCLYHVYLCLLALIKELYGVVLFHTFY